MSWPSRLFAFLTLTIVATATLTAQPPRKLPEALTQMIDAERAFAARALVVGWKQAFLEYFADDAVGFEGGPGLAKEQIRKNPDPPSDLQLLWEPRYGDVAASGDLGYLTGPVRNIRTSRDNGRPRHSTYASIWKRQRDGSFKVVMDFGLGTPGPVSFAAGFTRAPVGNRFSGDYDETTPPLSAADGVLNSGLRTHQADGYRGRLASRRPVPAARTPFRSLAIARPCGGWPRSRPTPPSTRDLRSPPDRATRLHVGQLRQRARPETHATGLLRPRLAARAKRPVERRHGRAPAAARVE